MPCRFRHEPRATVLSDPPEVLESLIRQLAPPPGEGAAEEGFELAPAMAAVERRTILRALAATENNKVEAASLLGIGERTLWTKLKTHGI